MKNRKKIVFPFIFVSFLAACGGSDENYSENITKTNFRTLLGPESITNHADTSRGCVDGAGSGVMLGHISDIAINASALQALTLERAVCDASYRVRVFDIESKEIKTQFMAPPYHPQMQGPLTTLASPSAIAMAKDGGLLIADSEGFAGGLAISNRNKPGHGNGIWHLDSEGRLSQLAGFATPNPRVAGPGEQQKDGTGKQAVFSLIDKICPQGSSEDYYLLDKNIVRHITKSGSVTTLINENGGAYQGLHCSSDGRALSSFIDTNGQFKAVELVSDTQYSITKAMFNSIQTLATDGKAWIRLDDDMALLDLHTGEVIKDSKIATNGAKGDTGKAPNPIGRGFAHYQGDSAIYASTTSLVMLKYSD